MDGGDRAAALALEYPSVAFFGITPFRAGDGPALARCAKLDFADVLVEGIDESVLRDLVTRHGYSARFASALASPPPALSLGSPLHLAAWTFIVGGAGRPIRTSMLASALRVTREHSDGRAITAALGIASFPADGDTAAALLRTADRTLYAAKQGGGNRTVTPSALS